MRNIEHRETAFAMQTIDILCTFAGLVVIEELAGGRVGCTVNPLRPSVIGLQTQRLSETAAQFGCEGVVARTDSIGDEKNRTEVRVQAEGLAEVRRIQHVSCHSIHVIDTLKVDPICSHIADLSDPAILYLALDIEKPVLAILRF